MSEVIPFRRGGIVKPQEMVLRFIDSPGHRKDAEAYLNMFASQKPEGFALVVVGEDVLRGDLDSLIFELRYLVKMALFPVLLVYASDDVLAEVDVEHHFDRARMPVSFLADDLNPLEKLEYIQNRTERKILSMLHIPAEQNLFTELGKMTRLLKSKKIIYIRQGGGFVDQRDENKLSMIRLNYDKKDLVEQNALSAEDLKFIDGAQKVIEDCDHNVTVSVVTATNFLRELFTVKGAGTLIQLGSAIQHFTSWDDVNIDGLKVLLQTSYEKKLRDDFFSRQIDHFYIEEDYKGVALLRDVEDMSFMMKFGAGIEARGYGIGDLIWNEMTGNHKSIFWRSVPERFINRWYTKHCDGLHRTKDWVVFWKGLEPKQITTAIDYALEQEPDFENA